MLPELGLYALLLACLFSIAQMCLPVWGYFARRPLLCATAVPLSGLVFGLTLVSFVLLIQVFLNDNFSVLYAANNSNSLLPWYYKVSAVWGAHEGSMLLWVLVLTSWTFLLALLSRGMSAEIRALVLAVQAMLAVGFYLFLILTSNPFVRDLPFPRSDGADLNPLLQDFGLIVHPPLLYMGYVGFSVAYSFAVASLITGQLDQVWARWIRPWTNAAWAFLSIGIALGSWWAYYELGWGGWWFWDPVENASFMPWLVGTALVHSLAVSEQRNLFKRWTLVLAIGAFSLSLLGTFLVRSGVLTSVHAFATDPERGLFILLFLLLMVGGAFLLFALRARSLEAQDGFLLVSRESGLLFNNLLLVIIASMVLIGTLYPLAIEALGLRSVSIGAPYFNLMFIIFMVPTLALLGVGQRLRWKRSAPDWVARISRLPLLAALGLAVVPNLIFGTLSIGLYAASVLSFWVLFQSFSELWSRTQRGKSRTEALLRTPLRVWGMHVAHWGVAVCAIGAVYSSVLSDSLDVRLGPGDSATVAGYTFYLNEYQQVRGANYLAEQGEVDVLKNGRVIALLQPQKRRYLAGGDTMTEAGISGNLWRDLYISMGEPLEGGAWAVRIHYKPFVRWIWFGAAIMALGGALAAVDKRYQRVREAGSKRSSEQRALGTLQEKA